MEEADEQVKAVYAALAEAYPEGGRGRSGRVVPVGLVPGAGRTAVKTFLGVLMAMVTLILVVTCTNVAGMFVARASARQREIAVRLALGAGRGGLVRQLLTESLTIFVVGGALGTAVGLWLLGLVPLDRLPVPIPVHVDLSPDPVVLLFALAVTLGSGLLRRFFVAGQVGFSLVLLASAGLFLRSLQRASSVETGFDPSDAYLTSVDLSLEGYEPEEGMVFQRELLNRLSGHPGVEAAGLSLDLPLDLGRSATTMYPEGWNGSEGREGLNADFNFVSPGYFRALGIPVLEGRVLTDRDDAGADPVVVVSRTFAERVWPGEPSFSPGSASTGSWRTRSPAARVRSACGWRWAPAEPGSWGWWCAAVSCWLFRGWWWEGRPPLPPGTSCAPSFWD